jgi:hypothetical protein
MLLISIYALTIHRYVCIVNQYLCDKYKIKILNSGI